MQLFDVQQVAKMVGTTRATVYKMMDAGTFPRPIYIGKRSPRWTENDLEKWLAGRERERARGLKNGRQAAA